MENILKVPKKCYNFKWSWPSTEDCSVILDKICFEFATKEAKKKFAETQKGLQPKRYTSVTTVGILTVVVSNTEPQVNDNLKYWSRNICTGQLENWKNTRVTCLCI